MYHVHWKISIDEGATACCQPNIETSPRVCWEVCLTAGPGAGIGHKIVARLAKLLCVSVQLCRPTPAVFAQCCLEVGPASQICLRYTAASCLYPVHCLNLLLCRSDRMLAVHVHTSIFVCIYPISSVHTKFFCTFYIQTFSRFRSWMMPLWHPLAFCEISKLVRPLMKNLFPLISPWLIMLQY